MAARLIEKRANALLYSNLRTASMTPQSVYHVAAVLAVVLNALDSGQQGVSMKHLYTLKTAFLPLPFVKHVP